MAYPDNSLKTMLLLTKQITFKIVIRIKNNLSKPKPILNSAPLGSLSGPILFSIYINENHVFYFATFAVDTAMFNKHKHAHNVFSNSNQNFSLIKKVKRKSQQCQRCHHFLHV